MNVIVFNVLFKYTQLLYLELLESNNHSQYLMTRIFHGYMSFSGETSNFFWGK